MDLQLSSNETLRVRANVVLIQTAGYTRSCIRICEQTQTREFTQMRAAPKNRSQTHFAHIYALPIKRHAFF